MNEMLHTTEAVCGCNDIQCPATRSTPTIVCIDDDAEIARIWQMRLARFGVTVVCATNGEDGFSAAVEKRPDLILLDLCMPGQDGRQVLARLRHHPTTKKIPVLMLTGDAFSARRHTSHEQADDYLSKPLNFGQLLEKLQAYIPLGS